MKGASGFRARMATFFSLMLFLGVGTGCEGESSPVQVTLFHTNDIHCHFRAAKGAPFGLGGMARLATLLKERRAALPEESHSFAMDAGDWCEGTWYYNIDTGATMLRLFDLLDYDAAVVGNHDYLAGGDRMIATVDEAAPSFPVLAANFDLSGFGRAKEFRERIPEYAILEREGLKVGVIGLTVSEITYVEWLKPIEATFPGVKAIELAAKLRPQVDLLVLLSHNDFELNKQMARFVPGVDVVVSGHAHRKVPRVVLMQNITTRRDVPVVETGEWGQFLGELTLEVDRGKKATRVLGYELHPVLPTVAEDAEVVAFVDAADAALERVSGGRKIHEVVAHSEVDLHHEDSYEAGLGHLATKAYRHAVPAAEAALEVLALTGVKLAAGPLTVMDLHDVMPHIYRAETGREWTIHTWRATGADLWKIATVFYTLPNNAGDFLKRTGFLAGDGFEVEWEPQSETNPVAQVREVRIGGRPVELGRRYTVAITDGMKVALQMVKEKLDLGLDLTQIADTGIEAPFAVVDYGAAVGTLTAEALVSGGRSRVRGSDPAVFHYGIRRVEGGLRVTVSNEGIWPSVSPVMVVCSQGRKDDYLYFLTEEEPAYQPFASVEIPPLVPDERREVFLPWTPASPGHWPVRCEVRSQEDGYKANSSAVKLVRVPVSPPVPSSVQS